MVINKYTDQFKLAVARAEAVQKEHVDGDTQTDSLLDAALEQLLVASENLINAEEELRQQEETLAQARDTARRDQQRYQQLFEFAPDGYLVTRLDGTIKMVNRVAAGMLGIEPQYLIRKPLAVYIAHDQREFFRNQLNRLRTAGAAERWETRLQPRHQAAMEVMLAVVRSVSPLTEDAGELLWQVRDMTDYKQKEQTEREQFFRDTFEQSPIGIGHIGSRGEWLHVNAKLCEIFGYSANELKAISFIDMSLPEDRALTQKIFLQLKEGRREKATREKRYYHKNGTIIWALINVSAVRSPDGKFLYNIVVVEDITKRKQIEANEHEQWLIAETLRDTALVLTSTLNFSEVTEQILINLSRVVPHDAASFLLIENETAYVERARGYDQSLETGLKGFHIAFADSDRINQMLRTRKPVLIPRWNDHGSWDVIPGMERMCSLVAAPILDRENVIGFLKLHSQTADFFTEEHAKLLQVFAAQVAIAIRNARAHEQAQALAVLKERHRLARELHDAVTQTLFSANVIADSLPRLWQNIPNPIQIQLQQLQVLTRGALAEMRALLLELRPEYLANIDLEGQIRQLLDAVKARKHIEVDFRAEITISIPAPVRITFYRIAQEALNNIVKHAHATHIQMTLTGYGDCLQLIVQDDGIGFDEDEERTGFGLSTMGERADEISATLEIVTMPQAGTKVSVIWETPKES